MMERTYYNQFVILNVVSWASGFNASHVYRSGTHFVCGLCHSGLWLQFLCLFAHSFIHTCAELAKAWILSPPSSSMVFKAQGQSSYYLKHSNITWSDAIRWQHTSASQNTGLRSSAVIDLQKAYDVYNQSFTICCISDSFIQYLLS